MKPNFDKPWEVIAHDYNSPLFRNHIWVSCQFRYPKLLDVPSPVFCILSEQDNIHYAADMESWATTHEALKAKCQKDAHYLENLIDATTEFGETFNAWSESQIFQKDVTIFTNEQIADLLDQFAEKQSTLYTYGVALPILDFQSFAFVENALNDFLSQRSSGSQYDEYYQVFTAPLHNSFALDQEQDLLRLMSKYYADSSWQKAIVESSADEIKQNYGAFWHDLEQHTQKYGWVYYVYAGPAFSETQFLEFIQDYLKQQVEPQKRLGEMIAEQRKIDALREQYIKELKPDVFNEMIFRLASKMVWAKPRRKDYQSKSYYHIEKLMREIGRRLGLSLRQARSIPPHMIREALSSGHIDVNLVNSLHNIHVVVPTDNGQVHILQDAEAQAFAKKYFHQQSETTTVPVSELKGNCACKGFAKGTVRIVNWTGDMHKMKDGDILVSIATTPAIVPSMKKAAAIVTDEGGLTCHASIVSRELNIPCVVGTKVATSTFKDGDMVEVDASNGIIRKVA